MGKMFVERHLLTGKTALDIGCGVGAHDVAFAEKYDKVDAIDLNISKVEPRKLEQISKAAEKITFRKWDAHMIDKMNKKWDLIYTLSTFEHLRDWRKVMKLVPECLVKTGKFYLVISPLYFSPLGHHLDPQIRDWEHLLLPESDLVKKYMENGGSEYGWKNYAELNKVMAKELINEARKDMKIQFLKADITTIEMLCVLE